jgi:hypothetical protein
LSPVRGLAAFSFSCFIESSVVQRLIKIFLTGLVPIAYYTLIDKGLKTVQVFRS